MGKGGGKKNTTKNTTTGASASASLASRPGHPNPSNKNSNNNSNSGNDNLPYDVSTWQPSLLDHPSTSKSTSKSTGPTAKPNASKVLAATKVLANSMRTTTATASGPSKPPPHRADFSPGQRSNQKLRKILMENLDTSNDEEWFAFVDILTDSISRQIRSGMVPGQRDSPPLNDVLWVLTDACYRGKLKEVIHLLSGDHVDVNEFFKVPKLDVQWTPLTSAAMGGQTTLVKILISKYGARVDNPNTRGMTALTAAAFAGFPEICKILLDNGANIETPGLRGETALIGAASGGHGTTVDLLMKRGADVEAVDSDGRTALMKAAKYGCMGTVDLLLTRYGADCTVRDKDGLTAEARAKEEGYDDVAQLIGTLSACPEIFEARKRLDEMYKKVEAALDVQLVAEHKLEEYMRQLHDEDKKTMLQKKERAIRESINSEDVLVEYQRRLLEAGEPDEEGVRAALDPALVREAIESVDKNTRETEAEMLGFVKAVEDLGKHLERLAFCRKALLVCKKELEDQESWHRTLPEQVQAIKERWKTTAETKTETKTETTGQGGNAGATVDGALFGVAVDGDFDYMSFLTSLESRVRGWFVLVEKIRTVSDSVIGSNDQPLEVLLRQSEAAYEACTEYLDLSKEVKEALSLIEKHSELVDLCGGKAAAEAGAGAGANPNATLNGSASGSGAGSGPTSDAASGLAPDTVAATGASPSTMEAAKVLDFLEIKLEGDVYRKGSLASGKDKRFEDGKRAARRSHRNWQLTKDTDSEIAAQHQAAHKIADLLQKNKI